MPNDPQLAASIVALLTTYLLHSTLLLGGVWLSFSLTRTRSAVLQDRLWKLAALTPVLTAPLQLAAADRLGAMSVWTLPAVAFDSNSQESKAPPRRMRPLVGDSNAREGEAPAEPHAKNPTQFESPGSLGMPPDDSPTGEPAFVELVPGRTSPNFDLDAQLPTIEPAPADTDEAHRVVSPEPAINPHDSPPEPAVVAADIDEPTSKSSSTNLPVAAPPFDAASPTWRRPLAAVVGLMISLGLLRLTWRSLTARRRLRHSETITDGALRDSLDRLLKGRGVGRTVRLAQSSAAREPAAGGVLRWTIIVPAGIEDRLTPSEQQALLAHELAHLVRRDPLWLWVGTALCTCLPLQPLNFLAVRRWRQAAEELCDDWAIAGGVRPLTLANCLTRVAEWRLAPMPLGLTADVGKSRFARRINRLVSGEFHSDRWAHPGRRRVLLAAVTGCALLLICCGPRMQAGSAQVESAARTDAAPPPAQESDEWVAGTGLSAAKPAPDTRVADRADAHPLDEPQANAESKTDRTPDAHAELASLLADLERVESLIGELGDDPELTTARSRLRTRLDAIRRRLK